MDRSKQTMRKLLFVLPFFLLWHFNSFGQHTVTGTVTDASNGETLPGVNILILGTAQGTSTDVNGEYSLSVPSSADTLLFSFVGFESETVPVNGRSEIDVAMQPASEFLEEVVVVGYGEQTKESVVGAISSISGGDLEKAYEGSNFVQSLQGQAPGVTMFTQSAKPGETSTQIQIRAATSMSSNTPLFILDGVEVQSIAGIDPIDIENVSVLKGAAATAVYGVKAANGVIILKSKRGRPGNLNLSFSSDVSVKEATRLPEFMDAYETLKLRNEAYKNDGQWDRIISDEVLEHYRVQDMPYIYPDFDWNEFYWKPAVDHKYNLNASGGNDFVQFFTSVSYLSEGDIMNMGDGGVFPYDLDHNYSNDRYNYRNNLDFNLTEATRLSVQLSGYVQEWNKPRDYYTQEMFFEPVTSMPYYPAEALEQFPDDNIPFDQEGPRPFNDPTQGDPRLLWTGGLGVIEQTSNDFNANVILKQDLDFITRGLAFTSRYSYQSYRRYGSEHTVNSFYAYHLKPDSTWVRYHNGGDIDLNTPQPRINIDPTRNLWEADRSHNYRVQFDYKQNFESHNFAGTALFTRRQAQGISNFPSYEEDWIGRTTYNYDRRYFLEASIAHSGSEKFAPGLRFGTFPSFAGGWLISNEDFFQPATSWFNYFKIRYEWGNIGSDAGIGRWLYQSSYQSHPDNYSAVFGYPRQSYSVLSEGNVPIPNATWETANKQNLGIEMGFFEDLITLNVDLYNEKRTDILQSRNSVPSWLGTTSSVYANTGETKAHGIEFELGINKTFNGGLNLFLNGNLAMHESRVVEWDEPDTIPFHLRAEGKPVGLARRMGWYTPQAGVEVLGYYQNFDELFMHPLASGTPIVGDHAFLDFNGDGEVNSLDRVVAQNPFEPSYNWNVDFGFNYKNWSAQVQFYGISDVNYPLRQGGMFFLYPFTQNKNNAMTIHADRWTSDNRDAAYPAVHAHAQEHYNIRMSSFSILNGQYVRLKSANVGYRLQSEGLTKMGVSQIDFTLSGTNLFTWTKLPMGGDPEGANYGQDFGSYPLQRRFRLGARITF